MRNHDHHVSVLSPGWALLLALLLLPISACSEKPESPPPPAAPTPSTQADEHFQRAIDYLVRFGDSDPNTARERIHHHLSQWLIEQPSSTGWTAEPLITQLPNRYQVKNPVRDVGERRFIGGWKYEDAYILHEAMMMRDVAAWVAVSEVHDPAMATWLEQVAAEKGKEYAEQLTGAWLLFDWTVRNVQLDPLPTVEDLLLPPGTSLEEEQPENPGSPELRARRLAGARYGAGEALELGHGDALTRSNIFALLVRQWSDMEVVLVATERVEGLPNVWSTGLVLDEEIYLFDTELGLPIPAAGDVGIATLNEILESPELLRQLDLPDEPYPVKAEELEPVYLLVIASPEYLSERMELVEQALPPEQALQLSFSPSAMLGQLRQHRGVADVLLWIGPYELFLYLDRLLKSEEAAGERAVEALPFAAYTPLYGARESHLVGEFDSTPAESGAKELYMGCRLPDRQITGVDTRRMAEATLRESGAMPVDPLEQEAAIRIQQAVLQQRLLLAQRMKRDSTYWLGLVAFEDGDYETATNYLKDRVLESTTATSWKPGARYNLARTYERMAAENIDPTLLEAAIELYETDDSPQRHGNLLRARRLAGQGASEQAATTDEAQEPVETPAATADEAAGEPEPAPAGTE